MINLVLHLFLACLTLILCTSSDLKRTKILYSIAFVCWITCVMFDILRLNGILI